MPRARKNSEILNIRIDADISHMLSEVSEQAGQTKTLIVERALKAYCDDFYHKQHIIEQAEAGKLIPVEEVNHSDD